MPKVNVYLPERLAEAVRALGIPLSETCQEALQASVSAGLPIQMLTPRARKILLGAAKEARDLDHDYIGTEHLLLALISERDGIAGQVLHKLGVAKPVAARVHEVLSSEGYRTPTNQVVDATGKVIGYLEERNGASLLVDQAGKPIAWPKPGKN